jgi:Trk K+ transport system NAD-binding subunit
VVSQDEPTMSRLLYFPLRGLAVVVGALLVVMLCATGAYVSAGWSLKDAIYMVVLTVYSVGYREVRPVDTAFLYTVTVTLIILGCTGMILLTGILAQALTFTQFQTLLGVNRMKTEIDKLTGHIIICGFGRLGTMLAQELKAGKANFVVVDRSEERLAQARERGYLCIHADATEEDTLRSAGIVRARALATVLPDDAANVFITLSARSLNKDLLIIARGEMPATESKLVQAGANKVVLPAHIGAERVAEMVLFPQTKQFIHGSEQMRKTERLLRDMGLDVEMAVVEKDSQADGITLRELERRANGTILVVQIDQRGGKTLARPDVGTVISAGDGVVLIGRGTEIVTPYFSRSKV